MGLEVARELEVKRKKDAFFFVKKDYADDLATLIDSLEEYTRWQDWRDYAGRTMWRCAGELRSARVQKVLAHRLGIEAPEESGKERRSVMTTLDEVRFMRQTSDNSSPVSNSVPSYFTGISTHEVMTVEGVVQASNIAPPSPKNSEHTALWSGLGKVPEPTSHTDGVCAPVSSPLPSPIDGSVPSSVPSSPLPLDIGKLKKKALRAVVQDDYLTLDELLCSVPIDVWTSWQNGAGKDLLTLSEERGSGSAYSVIAKALGILKEAKRDTFEEQETVWVFLNGEVQPRHATVLKDTPEEAETVLIEYWDYKEPPSYVERSMIRKTEA